MAFLIRRKETEIISRLKGKSYTDISDLMTNASFQWAQPQVVLTEGMTERTKIL